MDDKLQKSPYGAFIEHCKQGQLAYQYCTDNDKAVFFPRVIAPGSGSPNLEWRVSKGLGTVHAINISAGLTSLKPQPWVRGGCSYGFKSR